MTASIVVVVTSPRVAPGLLDVAAWDLLRAAGTVCCGSADHPQRAALAAAGIAVEVLADAGQRAAVTAEALRRRAHADPSRPVVWLAAPAAGTLPAGETPGADGALWAGGAEPGGEHGLLDALAAAAGADLTVTAVQGSRDLPGARLLDAVAVMDRLRSPGGCPWDAEQTHTSLASYLLEEAYEAYQAIEDGNHADLREELGDVLMQVLFHARIAAEGNGWPAGPDDAGTPGTGAAPDDRNSDDRSGDDRSGDDRQGDDRNSAAWDNTPLNGAGRDETARNGAVRGGEEARRGTAVWDIDDVAAGLADKLVRRHPHVFGSVRVDGAAAVETNWDKIKDVEKGRRSVTEGVPLSQPALALAAKLQKRAAKVGVPDEIVLSGA
ncbi:MazG family protein, partial [Frankia sp. CiP1_Cm_nod2]|uniref:MazG family protein n=1 Tax=Frankia sp. CiP1_Cm_nod2 TaxID=2897161 RepID=UPI0020252462